MEKLIDDQPETPQWQPGEHELMRCTSCNLEINQDQLGASASCPRCGKNAWVLAREGAGERVQIPLPADKPTEASER